MYASASKTRFSEELWVTKHSPSNPSDLGVHKKKVEEVLAWVETNSRSACKKASILLLVGSTGVGKTITLHVAAKQLNVEVVEWINPLTDIDADSARTYSYESVSHYRFKESQTSKFAEFLLRTNRYPSLSIFGSETFRSKILLVEDFPNSVLQDPKKFHEILRSYLKRGAGPLVFVINDSSNASSSSERLLFPPDVQTSLHIDVIRFNPIAPTSMTKVLLKIAANESRQSPAAIRMPSAETVDCLVSTSGGDIRSAINSLQFYCLNSPKLTSAKTKQASLTTNGSRKCSYSSKTKSNSKTVAPSSDETSIGVRDTNLTLFRALGRILYCKREERHNVEECVTLPDSLAIYRRDALSIVPEEVVEKSQLSPDGFTAFIHQNFLDFYTSLDDIALACEYLSDSDYLTREWSSRYILDRYSSSVAVRGVLFCNTSRATVKPTSCTSGLGWKPLHKPKWFDAIKKFRENRESVQGLFTEFRLSATELVTGLLPYTAILNTPSFSQRQAGLAKELSKFTKSSVQSLPEKLDEKDFVISEENLDDFQDTGQNSVEQNSCQRSKISNGVQNNDLDEYSSELLRTEHLDSDDEFNIEEFDD